MRFTFQDVLKVIKALNVVYSDICLADILKSEHIIVLLSLDMYISIPWP